MTDAATLVKSTPYDISSAFGYIALEWRFLIVFLIFTPSVDLVAVTYAKIESPDSTLVATKWTTIAHERRAFH